MPKAELNVQALYATLDSARLERGITWKKLASEAEISASTLTRMAQGKRPDVDGLTSLLNWLKMDIHDFSNIRMNESSKIDDNTLARITALLRSDAQLTPESAEALEGILRASYESLRRANPR